MDYEKVYGKLHARDKVFSGYSIEPSVQRIAELVSETGASRLIDYGSGKGYQYLARRVHRHWGGILPYCYDPGVRQLRERPEGLFDGLICTDVMEHIEEGDVDRILEDAFGFINPYEHAFAYFYIACRPAKSKRLPDGRNVHVTVKAPGWWRDKLARFKRTGLIIEAKFDTG